MSSLEITQADYLAVMGLNPSAVNQEKCGGVRYNQYPVDSVRMTQSAAQYKRVENVRYSEPWE